VGGFWEWEKSSTFAFLFYLIKIMETENQSQRDWELTHKINLIDVACVIEILRTDLTEDEAREIYESLALGENKYDGRQVVFIHNTFGKIIKHKGVDTKQIIPQLKEIFDNSVPIYFETERQQAPRADGKAHKPHNNIVGYHNYLAKIRMENENYYVRFTVQQLNTRKKDFVANQLHSTFITNIDVYNANAVSISIKPSGTYPIMENTNGVVDAKLQHFFELAINLQKKCNK
jgi:hypothetical protein